MFERGRRYRVRHLLAADTVLSMPETGIEVTLAEIYERVDFSPMAEHRHVRLFRNGRNRAVRIPVEFELPGDEAIIYRNGDRLVIEPVRKRGLIASLKTMKPLNEDFPRSAIRCRESVL